MAQYDYGNPQPPFSGTQLNTTLRNWRDALHTLHRGASRPSYVQGGMLWVREVSSTQWELTFYDGADDILVATINPSTNTITPAGAATPTDLETRVAKAGDTMAGPLTLPGAPTAANHAATKAYVDTATSARVAKSGDTMTGFLTLHANPTAAMHAATKQYVDSMSSSGNYVLKTGDTMTGPLTLPGAPTAANHAATKAYVDTATSARVAKSGDTMTGFLTLHANPTAAMHAVTKAYVDAIIGSGRRLTGVFVFHTSQTWTPPSGTTAMLVWAVGGGGGGGRGGRVVVY